MSRRNVKKQGRQTAVAVSRFRMKKKSRADKEKDRYDRHIAYIADEDSFTSKLLVESLKRYMEKLKQSSSLS
ncbi:hypothetical protein SAMN05428949_5331 [Chitinophaga sp. YR627]|uniref:hypothetical protein n=1 Tax=Chitinophaga sp. YR627 TaxID=1881041 RepID=UPI0008E9A58D|nr:hypothetical protein [Chitinophaga sp. YR627]SFO48047.1 hypothetical protein SAMN05428949_5331 [Chitinophaga sp. YR627]